MKSKAKEFVIFDRDGTVIKECHYLSDPNQVELLSGAVAGMKLLQSMGLGLVIVTNQSAIGRGFFDEIRLSQIHQRLQELLAAEDVFLDSIYYCPHIPAADCNCRKPRTGLLEIAAKDLGFKPSETFIIGDKPCDIDLGENVGATTFLVRTGYGASVAAANQTNPNYIVDNLLQAAQVIESILNKRRTVNAATS